MSISISMERKRLIYFQELTPTTVLTSPNSADRLETQGRVGAAVGVTQPQPEAGSIPSS